MALKLVNKNNMGIVLTLILVVLLSQSKFFDFLTETHLGRIVLLAFIIFISYTSKFLGLFAVLFIIIGFNMNEYNTVYSYNYFEGFDISGNKIDISDHKIDISGNTIDISGNLLKSKINSIAHMVNSSSSASTTNGQEGFCMPDRELNILRGKQSNTIPVYNKSREQNDYVDPSDKSVFSSDYALF